MNKINNVPKRGRGQPKKAPTGTISYRVPLHIAERWRNLSEAHKVLIKIEVEKAVVRLSG